MSLMSIYKISSHQPQFSLDLLAFWEVSPLNLLYFFLQLNMFPLVLSSLVLFKLFPFVFRLLSDFCLMIFVALSLTFRIKTFSALISLATSSMMSSSFVSIFSFSFCFQVFFQSRGFASAKKSASGPLLDHTFLLAIFLLSPLFSI